MFCAEVVSALPAPSSHPSGEDLFRLGLRYSTGTSGSPVDLVTAHTLFNLASARGSLEAKIYRKELSAEMDSSDIAEAQRAAREWLARA